MPLPNYELWLTTDTGSRLALLDDVGGFEYVLRTNGAGAVTVNLPVGFDVSLLGIADERPDRRIEIWRGAFNIRKSLEIIGLIRKLQQSTRSSGEEFLTVSGPDQNDLIDRRIIAYFSGTNEASKNAEADDVIKEFAEENFGATAVGLRRDWSGDGVSIQADLTLAPVVDKQAAWRRLLTTFESAVDSAQSEGTRTYFAMAPVSPRSFQLQTWINQPGQNLTSSVVFSLKRANLDNPSLTYDYTKEATVIYSAGQGQGTARMLAIVTDVTRINSSIFNRREVFHDARNSDTLNAVIDEGKARMASSTPLLRFTGSIRDTPKTRYGVDWRFGDRVRVDYKGQQFDSIVNAVRVRVDGQGRENITAKVENVTLGQVGDLLIDTIQTPGFAAKGTGTQGPSINPPPP